MKGISMHRRETSMLELEKKEAERGSRAARLLEFDRLGLGLFTSCALFFQTRKNPFRDRQGGFFRLKWGWGTGSLGLSPEAAGAALQSHCTVEALGSSHG